MKKQKKTRTAKPQKEVRIDHRTVILVDYDIPDKKAKKDFLAKLEGADLNRMGNKKRGFQDLNDQIAAMKES